MIFRITGLVLGLVATGTFWGGLAGYLLGSVIDGLFNSRIKGSSRFTFSRHFFDQGMFVDSLMQLTAVVVKADQRMLKSELDFVKSYLVKNLGTAEAQRAILKLRDYLNEDIDYQTVCANIRHNASIQERLLIIQFLLGLAQADGNIDSSEMTIIQQIAQAMGISTTDFEALKAMFLGYAYRSGFGGYGYGNAGYGSGNYSSGSSANYNNFSNIDDDYKILEITADASDDEVKKAYRKAAMKHHPDKVSHLGEDVRKAAEEKFAKVNEAYNRIKKSRGMN